MPGHGRRYAQEAKGPGRKRICVGRSQVYRYRTLNMHTQQKYSLIITVNHATISEYKKTVHSPRSLLLKLNTGSEGGITILDSSAALVPMKRNAGRVLQACRGNTISESVTSCQETKERKGCRRRNEAPTTWRRTRPQGPWPSSPYTWPSGAQQLSLLLRLQSCQRAVCR